MLLEGFTNHLCALTALEVFVTLYLFLSLFETQLIAMDGVLLTQAIFSVSILELVLEIGEGCILLAKGLDSLLFLLHECHLHLQALGLLEVVQT